MRGTRLFGWLPVVAWAALIFVLPAQPNLRFVSDAGLDFVVRKLGHIGVFGILALLVWRALAGTTAWRRPWAWAFALTVLYAASDELHQGFVAGRHPSAIDVGIDAAGALIALAVVGLIRSGVPDECAFRPKRSVSPEFSITPGRRPQSGRRGGSVHPLMLTSFPVCCG
jgi:VanZ family protein